MSKIFKSVVTVAGRKKIAAAIVSGNKVVFSQMSVGDGRGTAIIPDENKNSLINECFRTQLNSLKLSDTENIIIAEMIIPPEVGLPSGRQRCLTMPVFAWRLPTSRRPINQHLPKVRGALPF